MDVGEEGKNYSESATVIKFDRPLPLLRVPIRSGLTNTYLLAFPNPRAFRSSLALFQSTLRSQCVTGTRLGCSLKASKSCKPAWWHLWYHASSPEDMEACEVRVMQGCMARCEETCVEFAIQKCSKPFRDAQIALEDQMEGPNGMHCLGSVLLDSITQN